MQQKTFRLCRSRESDEVVKEVQCVAHFGVDLVVHEWGGSNRCAKDSYALGGKGDAEGLGHWLRNFGRAVVGLAYVLGALVNVITYVDRTNVSEHMHCHP
jgi:hypothetical protein